MVVSIIQVKHINCCSPGWRDANDSNTFHIPGKMISPYVLARVEDGHHFTCFRIISFQAIASTLVAVSVGQCQIVRIV
jgi:hypothetical protein